MPVFETIKAKSGTAVPLFIFGDHSSAHIPQAYNNLGLTGEDLTRHIAVDIGTESLIRNLCTRFGCAGHLAGVSRLVLDCNRDPDAPGLIPRVSDGTRIPGNENISPSERARRIAQIHTPYHAALGQALDRAAADTPDPLIVSMHSFTPQLKSGGAFRPTQIGLLRKADPDSTQRAAHVLARLHPDRAVAVNKPYSAFDLNYTVDTQVTPRGLRHITFEIRQDLIDTRDKIGVMSQVLDDVLSALI